METKKYETKTMPKPEYSKCNAGHELVLVYNELRNAYIWDCPLCISKMEKARAKSWQEKAQAILDNQSEEEKALSKAEIMNDEMEMEAEQRSIQQAEDGNCRGGW